MKNIFILKTFLLLLLSSLYGIGFGQVMSSNTINYKVSYDVALQKYTVWVVPNYSTPNANNAGSTEKGATAQVTLKVPTGFVISQITDVNGVWDKSPFKMGPNQQSQLAGQGLDVTKAYYTIGKGASETDYGQFISGTAVELFTFQGNGCFGPIEIIAKTDPFVTVSDAQLALNTAPSFYSRSGQPSGGNQDPLEQYNAPAAGPASCFDAINDTYTATAGTPAVQDVLTNDGINGGTPTASTVNITVPTQPSHGTTTVNPDGTITYTPTSGYSGPDSYTYQICDKANPTVCDVATVNVTVNCPVMAAPTASNPSAICSGTSTNLTATCTTGTLTWYSDAALTSTLASTTVSPSATTTYYAACLNGVCKSLATNVTVTVTATPVAPTSATASPSAICSGTSTTLSATCATGTLTWYSDAALTTTLASATVSPTTTSTYYAACVNGTCKSTATNVTVTVTATPVAPTSATASPSAICSGTNTTLSATCATGTLTWYSDAALTSTLASATVSPTATTTYYAACVNGTCKSLATDVTVTVTATPVAPTSATASPSAICSGTSTTLAATCATGTLTWYSDAALTTTLASTTVSPIITTTYYATCVNGTCKSLATNVTVTVTATPVTPTSATASPSAICSGTSTTLSATCATGTLVWYSDAALTSTLASTTVSPTATTTYYAACVNGTCKSLATDVTVTVTATPVAPTSATASPSTICSGTSTTLAATCATGTLTWYSDAALTTTLASTTVSPSVTMTYYAACLNGVCKSVATNVVVTVNNCKIIYAYNDNNVTLVNTPVSGSVLTNDDINNAVAPLVVSTTPVSQPTHGSVALNSNGTYSYTPAPNYTGNDSFKYRVCDSASPVVCDTATVFIDIIAPVNPTINNEPIALDDIQSTPKNAPFTFDALLNDKDPDAGQTLTPSLLTNPAHGTVVKNPNGTFTYTPNSDFVGDDSFTYQVCDNGSPVLCDQATVQIVVKDPALATNLAPVAGDDLATTPSGTPVGGNILLNDKDPENGVLTINTTPVTQPSNGSVVINPNGTYLYTPTAGFVGTDKFVYSVCDNGSPVKCTQATVYIEVLVTKVSLLPKAYLQGALFGVTGSNLMRDDLRVKGLIPTTSPYPAIGMTGITPTGTVAASVLAVTGADAIVDWVFVELRDANNNQQVLDSRSALIQRDGDIVDIDGISALTFNSATPASYYVVIKHRNHLGVMSKTALPLNATTTTVDFRTPSTPTYTFSTSVIDVAQVVVEQGVALWAGNALYDNKVIYQGTANDINTIYQQVISASGNLFVSPYFKLKGYYAGDINMNGEVIFQGTGNDVEYIYQNVIKNHGGNTLTQNFFIIKEQLP